MTTTPRAVVLVSGSGSNLQAIIDAAASKQFELDISLVISNVPNVKGLERARDHGIATQVVDHRDFTTREEFDQQLKSHIETVKPDLIVLAGFMRILTADFVEHYQDRLINIHPSLLPKFPGRDTHQRAIDAEEQWHGASVHFVVPEVDAGPVIDQGRLRLNESESANELQARVLKIEHVIYPLAVKWFAQQKLTIKNDLVLLDGEQSTLQLQTFDY
ncbi:MAG: phosphoribosylglycinamide formyltransferase [Pseudomonadota bacterium]